MIKHAILLILISMPAYAQDWNQVDQENAETYRHVETMRAEDFNSDNYGSQPQQPAMQPQPSQETDNRTGAQILQDCAASHSCGGVFDPYNRN